MSALLATRDELMRLQRDPRLMFVAYGWWVPRDLEYVLPTVGNFTDVLRLSPGEVNGKTIVPVRSEFFNWERSGSIDKFQAACDRHTVRHLGVSITSSRHQVTRQIERAASAPEGCTTSRRGCHTSMFHDVAVPP